MNIISSKSGKLSGFHGIILADKAGGMTSYDILRKMKKVFF